MPETSVACPQCWKEIKPFKVKPPVAWRTKRIAIDTAVVTVGVLVIVGVVGALLPRDAIRTDIEPDMETEPASALEASARATTREQESSLEFKLAVVHRGGYVPENDPLVAEFATALDRLEAKCPEDRPTLGDMGVTGQRLLAADGINEPLLDVFQNWRASIPDYAEDGDVGPCADIMAAYVALRVGQ